MLVEIRRVSHKCAAAQVLDGPRNADNFRTAEVDAFEAVPVAGAGLDGFLELVGRHHHGDCLVDVEGVVSVLLRCEGKQGFLGVFRAASADEPPEFS